MCSSWLSVAKAVLRRAVDERAAGNGLRPASLFLLLSGTRWAFDWREPHHTQI